MRWERLKISDFSQVITGGTPSTSKKEYWENGSIPWLNSGELNQNIIETCENKITELGLQNSSTRIMPPETVLIALTGTTTGVVGYLTFEACANQSVTGILPSPKHHPKYLFYFLKSIRSKILEESYGGAQKHISQGYVKDLEVPLPPLETQKRIAKILDAADALRQKDQELLKKYDELAQAIFIDLFGDPVRNEKGWAKVELKNLVVFENGDRSSNYPSGDEVKDRGEIPFINSKYIRDNSFDNNITSFISVQKFNSLNRGKLQQGDVIISLRGSIGNCCIFQSEYTSGFINAQLMIIRCLKDLSNLFLHRYLTNETIQSILKNSNQGSAVPQLTSKQIGELCIYHPPINLQLQFSERVSEIEEQKGILQNNLEKSESLFNSLVQKAFKE